MYKLPPFKEENTGKALSMLRKKYKTIAGMPIDRWDRLPGTDAFVGTVHIGDINIQYTLDGVRGDFDEDLSPSDSLIIDDIAIMITTKGIFTPDDIRTLSECIKQMRPEKLNIQ